MKWELIAATLFVMVLVSGCLGNSSKTSDNGNTTTTPGEKTAVTGTDPGFSKLVGMYSTAAYSVTYSVTSGSGSEVQSSVIKQIVSGTKIRTEATVPGSSTKAVTIMANGKFYSCVLGSSQDTCFDMSGTQTSSDTADQTSSTVKQYKDVPDVKYDGTKTIAGVTTYCYKLTNAGANNRWCFDKDTGIMLGAYITDSGTTTTMEATSFSASAPADSMFVPPAPVQSMPSFGQ